MTAFVVLLVLANRPVLALKAPEGVPLPVEPAAPLAPEPGDTQTQQPAPRKPAPRPATSGDRFIPSERIEADSAVSFPVDI